MIAEMSDPLDVTNLEKDGRLMAIRKLRSALYRVQLVVAFVFSLLLIFTSGGFQLAPLFVPLESFIYFLLVLGLIVTLEVFVFRYLEISLSRSRTGRFYMVRKAQRRAVIYAVVSLGVLLLLITPAVSELSENIISSESEGVDVLAFYNKGVMGVSEVESVLVTSNQDVEVYIVTGEVYRTSGLNPTILLNNKLNTLYQISAADGQTEITLPEYGRTELYLVVMSGNSLSSADIVLETAVAPYITDVLPIFALIYAVAYISYAAWLTPKRYRMRTEAIYG